MLNLLGMEIDGPFGKGPYVEMLTVALLIIAILILLFGYYRKRNNEYAATSITDDVSEIQHFDMLGQPQVDHFKNLGVEDKILFAGANRKTVNRYRWYGILTLVSALLLYLISLYK